MEKSLSTKNYWVIRLGQGNKYAEIAYTSNCIAVGWQEVDIDLKDYIHLDQVEFTEKIAPMIREALPEKTDKYYAGSARQLYKFGTLAQKGDVVFVPAGSGKHFIGRIKSGYYHTSPQQDFPYKHRRDVEWIGIFNRDQFSEAMRGSIESPIMTIFSASKYAPEIEKLLTGGTQMIAGQEIEDIKNFGLESQLEDFLVHNWDKLLFSNEYEIYREDGEMVGQQYIIDIGRIDILTRSKDGKKWLIIELKKGRASDKVVGQLLRYVGYVKKHMAREDEMVEGLIIAGEDDEHIRYAISTSPHIKFMTYTVQFTLDQKTI